MASWHDEPDLLPHLDRSGKAPWLKKADDGSEEQVAHMKEQLENSGCKDDFDLGPSLRMVHRLLHRHINVSKDFYDRSLHRKALHDLKQRSNTAGPPQGRLNRLAHAWATRPMSIFGLPMIDPCGAFTILWRLFFLLLDCVYVAFWVPLSAAFCPAVRNPVTLCSVMDCVGGVLYVLNLLVSFQVGCVLTHGTLRLHSVTVCEGRTVVRAYMRFGGFWIDLLGALPFAIYISLAIVYAVNPAPDQMLNYLNLVGLLRLVRLFKVVSLSRLLLLAARSVALYKLLERYVRVLYIAMLVYLAMVVVNLQACMLMASAQYTGVYNSWLTNVFWLDGAQYHSKPLQWYLAVYLTIMTNTSVGSWGVNPVTLSEAVLCNAMMVIGMLMFGTIVSTAIFFATSLNEQGRLQYRLRLKLDRLQHFARAHRLPPPLMRKLKHFYRTEWAERRDAELLDVSLDLPVQLRESMREGALVKLLRQIQWLAGVDDHTKAVVARKMTLRQLAPGEHLCDEGDNPTHVWLLQSGTMSVRTLAGDAVASVDAPAMLGDAVVIADTVPACRDRLWCYSASAAGPCVLWCLPLAALATATAVCPALSVAYLAATKTRLILALAQGEDDAPGDNWSELVARCLHVLRRAARPVVECALSQLQVASAADASLPLLLDALLELSAMRRVDDGTIALALAVPDSGVDALVQLASAIAEDSTCGDDARSAAAAVPCFGSASAPPACFGSAPEASGTEALRCAGSWGMSVAAPGGTRGTAMPGHAGSAMRERSAARGIGDGGSGGGGSGGSGVAEGPGGEAADGGGVATHGRSEDRLLPPLELLALTSSVPLSGTAAAAAAGAPPQPRAHAPRHGGSVSAGGADPALFAGGWDPASFAGGPGAALSVGFDPSRLVPPGDRRRQVLSRLALVRAGAIESALSREGSVLVAGAAPASGVSSRDTSVRSGWDLSARGGWDPSANGGWDPSTRGGWDPGARGVPDASAQGSRQAGSPSGAEGALAANVRHQQPAPLVPHALSFMDMNPAVVAGVAPSPEAAVPMVLTPHTAAALQRRSFRLVSAGLAERSALQGLAPSQLQPAQLPPYSGTLNSQQLDPIEEARH